MITLKNVRYRGTRGGGGLGAEQAPSPEVLRAQADGFDRAAVALDKEVESKTQQASVMRGHNLDGPANNVMQEATAAQKKAAEAREKAKALRDQANKTKTETGVSPALVLAGLGLFWWAFGPRG